MPYLLNQPATGQGSCTQPTANSNIDVTTEQETPCWDHTNHWVERASCSTTSWRTSSGADADVTTCSGVEHTITLELHEMQHA